MKKVLFIIYTNSLGGGSEAVLTNIVNGLVKKGDYEISLLEFTHYTTKSEKIDDRIKYLPPITNMADEHKISRLIKLILVHIAPWLLRKIYIKERYDVEISFNRQIPSFLTSRRKEVYNIQWNHGDIYDLREMPFKRFLQGLSYKKADKIIAISNNTYNSIVELFPRYKEKLSIIYNGTDVADILKKSEEEAPVALKENSLVFLGRMEDNKNPLGLIEYLKRVIEEGLDVNLYLFGEGPQREEAEAYIKQHSLEDKIFVLGYIQNPFPIIKQAKGVCLLSKSEGFPTVFTEGLALGKPFITTKVGGADELSNYGQCGKVINSYEDFRNAVLEVVLDDKANKKMSNAAKKHIANFSIENQISEIANLIENR